MKETPGDCGDRQKKAKQKKQQQKKEQKRNGYL